MGSVITAFILFLVLRRFDVVGAMSVGSSGVLFYSSMRRDEMRGVSWHVWKRSESLPIPLWGCHETADFLEREAGSYLGNFA